MSLFFQIHLINNSTEYGKRKKWCRFGEHKINSFRKESLVLSHIDHSYFPELCFFLSPSYGLGALILDPGDYVAGTFLTHSHRALTLRPQTGKQRICLV